jgi:tetratricopeptide (TPR) repeat protein
MVAVLAALLVSLAAGWSAGAAEPAGPAREQAQPQATAESGDAAPRTTPLESGDAAPRTTPLESEAPGPRLAPLDPDSAVQIALRRARRQPRQADAYHRLGDAYIQKARASGDPGYFDRAEEAIRKSIDLGFDQAAAWRRLAYVALSRHQFEEARARAAQALARDPDDHDALGILGDAYLELGRYEEADQAYQRMMGLDASLGAYGRRSGLRALRGDTAGSIADLQRAVAVGQAAGAPRESVAWAQWQLGVELFNAGDLGRAEASQAAALATLPGYHRALGGLAQVRAAQGRGAEAMDLYRKALAALPAPEHAVALGDLLTSLGRQEEARKQYALVEQIARLSRANEALYNRELAYFYLDHDLKVEEALALARREIEVRRDVYGWDVLAWALLKNGRAQEAHDAMTEALRLGTRDPRLFFHAGMIHAKLGDAPRARDFLARALALNPHFHVLHASLAARTLEALHAR